MSQQIVNNESTISHEKVIFILYAYSMQNKMTI